jgi:hypothetical protein
MLIMKPSPTLPRRRPAAEGGTKLKDAKGGGDSDQRGRLAGALLSMIVLAFLQTGFGK